jgi:hypothetical protein
LQTHGEGGSYSIKGRLLYLRCSKVHGCALAHLGGGWRQEHGRLLLLQWRVAIGLITVGATMVVVVLTALASFHRGFPPQWWHGDVVANHHQVVQVRLIGVMRLVVLHGVDAVRSTVAHYQLRGALTLLQWM